MKGGREGGREEKREGGREVISMICIQKAMAGMK